VHVLGIDTSSPAVSVAVGTLDADLQMASGRARVANNRHGELLAPMIEERLEATGLQPTDLIAIAVGLGPGPFTGLRVGIMTAKAMGHALGIPVYGECSLDLIHPPEPDDEVAPVGVPYACMSDARRKQVYWAEYDAEGNRAAGPELSFPADLANQLRGRVSHLVGAGAVMYREHFHGFQIEENQPYPWPNALLPLIKERALAGAPSDDLAPLYLRRPDAVPPGAPKAVTPS
jgi:tRNA threonylcarbamoyl adenosine modification protein YeaZ